MTAPFTDAAIPEICARIIFRRASQVWHGALPDELTGAEVLIRVVEDLAPIKGALLHSCALSALFAYRKGIKLRKWRDFAITASRCGKGFRHCWYADYKAHRRDPRVTNRGVTPSSQSKAN
jgi:hypothetical protein